MAKRGQQSTLLGRLSGRDDPSASSNLEWVLGVLALGVLVLLLIIFWPDKGSFIYEGF